MNEGFYAEEVRNFLYNNAKELTQLTNKLYQTKHPYEINTIVSTVVDLYALGFTKKIATGGFYKDTFEYSKPFGKSYLHAFAYFIPNGLKISLHFYTNIKRVYLETSYETCWDDLTRIKETFPELVTRFKASFTDENE